MIFELPKCDESGFNHSLEWKYKSIFTSVTPWPVCEKRTQNGGQIFSYVTNTNFRSVFPRNSHNYTLSFIRQYREEVVTSRCHGSKISGPQQTVVLQILQEKKTKKLTCTTFLCMTALKNKTVAHTFLPSFNNANGRLCQEGLLGFRNFATMLLLSIRLILDDPHTHWCSSALKVSVICCY